MLMIGMFPPWNYIYKFPGQKILVKPAGFQFLLTPSRLPVISEAEKNINELSKQIETIKTKLDTSELHVKKLEERQKAILKKQFQQRIMEEGNLTRDEKLRLYFNMAVADPELPELSAWQAKRDAQKEELGRLQNKLHSFKREIKFTEPQINYKQLILQWTIVAITISGLMFIF